MEQSNFQKKGVAFFDLDGTITFKDSFLEFIKFSKGSFKFNLGLVVNSPYIFLYFLNLYPNDKLKERFFSFFFKNSKQLEVTELGVLFCQKQLSKICYPSAMKLINWHKAQDHTIYILTASSGIWLDDWCKSNDLQLIGTDFEVKNDTYTGKIAGINCYGLEKLNRIKNILAQYNFEQTYGYGNDKSDKYYLNELRFKLNGPLTEKNVALFLKFENS